jgi:transcriptional regulator with XRE-family HTH domain
VDELDSTIVQGFGSLIRTRRRQLELTQTEAARRAGTSVACIGHLEKGKRHPSAKMVAKLAEVLGLDPRKLFLLANPGTERLFSADREALSTSAWEAFCKDEDCRKLHNITDREMEALSGVAMLGEVRSPRDLLFILITIRQALGRE